MHLLLLPALLLAAPPDDGHASPKPPLELGRSGIVVSQYFSASRVEKYAGGVTPRREAGPRADYDETLAHAGAQSEVKAHLDARVEATSVVIEATASARLPAPADLFPADGLGLAAPEVWAVVKVNALRTQGLIVSIEGTATASGAGAETIVDILVDGREVAALRQLRDLRRRVAVPLSPGEHTVRIEVRATAALPAGAPAAADTTVNVVAHLSLDELPAPKAPARAKCATKALRFPASPRLADGRGHVTHVWPNDLTLAVVQPRAPLFLLRVDEGVDPEELSSRLSVTDGSWASWRAPALRLLACFEEQTGSRVFTTAVFQAVTPLPLAETNAQWMLGAGSPLETGAAPRFHPLTRALSGGGAPGGALALEGPGRRAGAPVQPDGVAWLLDTVHLSPELVAAELKNDREALELLRDWAKVEVKGALDAVKKHEQALAARTKKPLAPLATGTECGEDGPVAPARRPSPGHRPTSPRRRRERSATARRSPR